MLVHCRVALSITLAGTHSDNWVDGDVDVKALNGGS